MAKVVTISLEINRDKDLKLTKNFSTIENLRYAYIAKNVGNMTVTNVPEEIEYEVSKFIFNKVEMYCLKKANEELAKKIFEG